MALNLAAQDRGRGGSAEPARCGTAANGPRGDPGCSRAFADAQRRFLTLEDTLVRVSHLAMHTEGHLAELDINPLMVLPSGQGVKAVDALVVLRGT